MKKYSVHDTFCNPIVLPNYPNLQTIRELPEGMSFEEFIKSRPDPWGRRGKKLLDQFDIMRELGDDYLGSPESIADLTAPGYGHTPEQDVRATADPSPYYFEGKWWLYPTCGMIYSSEDLVNWTYHEEPTWKNISATMAPTVEKVGDRYVASGNSVPPHVSDNPVGPWTMLGEWTLPDGREFQAADVMIFADDDGRAYLYFGLGPGILGAEIDANRPNQLLTYPKFLIPFTKNYWWERLGASNEGWNLGAVEGSWMVKHGKTYYLVYSCAGTEFYNYAMGAYISDSPLGNFVPQPRNPVSRSREGFIKGGGHGGFVKGPEDTLWVFYTIPVSVDGTMERRIGMDPAGFDDEGNLFAITGIDVPQWKPGVMQRPELGNATQLKPLTIFKFTKVSSYAPGQRGLYALDESMHTWWQPAADDAEPCLATHLRGKYYASAVRIMWKDIGLRFSRGILPGPYRYVVELSENDKDWVTVVDASQNETDLAVDYRTFEPTYCAFARIRILGAPEGVTPGLMNFTIFGEAADKPDRQF